MDGLRGAGVARSGQCACTGSGASWVRVDLAALQLVGAVELAGAWAGGDGSRDWTVRVGSSGGEGDAVCAEKVNATAGVPVHVACGKALTGRYVSVWSGGNITLCEIEVFTTGALETHAFSSDAYAPWGSAEAVSYCSGWLQNAARSVALTYRRSVCKPLGAFSDETSASMTTASRTEAWNLKDLMSPSGSEWLHGPFGGASGAKTNFTGLEDHTFVEVRVLFWMVDMWEAGETGHMAIDGTTVWTAVAESGGSHAACTSPMTRPAHVLSDAGSNGWSGVFTTASYKVSFKSAGQPGYLMDTGAPFGPRKSLFYGWMCDEAPRDFSAAPQPAGTPFDGQNACSGTTSWRIALPNGQYLVRAVLNPNGGLALNVTLTEACP